MYKSPKAIKKLRECYKQVYAHKFDNLQKQTNSSKTTNYQTSTKKINNNLQKPYSHKFKSSKKRNVQAHIISP